MRFDMRRECPIYIHSKMAGDCTGSIFVSFSTISTPAPWKNTRMSVDFDNEKQIVL